MASKRAHVANVANALSRLTAVGLAALAMSTAAQAQQAPALQAELVKTGLYLIRGGGGNTLLRFSANGLVLVNGKSADSYKPLMSQVHKIDKLSDMPVRVLILTDAQEGEAANSARFIAAKVPILAQAQAAAHLGEGVAGPGLVTYDKDYTVKLGGVEVQVKHFGKAHSDGDAVVYFPDMKVVAVGSLYAPDGPALDVRNEGSLAGWSAALAQLLGLDFDRVVPNDGPIVGRAELEAFQRRLETLAATASAAPLP